MTDLYLVLHFLEFIFLCVVGLLAVLMLGALAHDIYSGLQRRSK